MKVGEVRMTAREDTIERIERVLGLAHKNSLTVEIPRLTAERAVALLKEQEARLMTLDEVKAFGWDYCYLEEERLPGKEYRSVCGDYVLTCITWPCIASMRTQYGDDRYGTKWRCWSAKPTDEQRQVEKWKK
jgi:hypothetical protein